jgi:HSP20 family protein
MSIIRYEPFAEVNGLFENLLRGFSLNSWPAQPSAAAAPAVPMRVDVSEKDGAYSVSADLPGFKKEDIRVTVEADVLTIAAETKSESEQKEGARVLYRERRARSFARSFRLGSGIDLEAAQAKYENGVLELTLPKSTADGVKRVTVH